MYMNRTYPEYNVVNSTNKKILSDWSQKDSISLEECEIYFEKKKIQKNENIILEKYCKNKLEV